MNILIAEDDADLTDITEYALRREGHAVTIAHTGEQALARLSTEQVDLVLLDLGLERFDGFEVCRRLRETSDVPVIVVTARSDESDMGRAFELGADDYMIKPISFRELLMRIGAVARRSSAASTSTLEAAGLRLDPSSGDVTFEGRPVSLTRLEFRLLYCLMANFRRVATTDRLLQFAWPSDRGEPGVLKTHISHLRSKLGVNRRPSSLLIENVAGVGYRLTDTDPAFG